VEFQRLPEAGVQLGRPAEQAAQPGRASPGPRQPLRRGALLVLRRQRLGALRPAGAQQRLHQLRDRRQVRIAQIDGAEQVDRSGQPVHGGVDLAGTDRQLAEGVLGPDPARLTGCRAQIDSASTASARHPSARP
jgi:hypothetical protein